MNDFEFNDRQQLDDYIQSKQSTATQRKTANDINRFRTWLATQNCHEPPENISPAQLDILIGHFIMPLKKADDSNYEPDTITSFHRSIERYLTNKNYKYNILTNPLFRTSRAVVAAKRKELKQQGLGNRPQKAEALTTDEENLLWETAQLGPHDPVTLIRTMWFFNTKLFGLRGSDENRKLHWGDVCLKCDENGEEYLEFNERQTKTRDGNTGYTRPFQPKMFPNKISPHKCPIMHYREYQKHRPAETLSNDSPFYLAVCHNRAPGSQLWYKKQPLGENSLRTMMKNMANAISLPGKKTNHSVRKTMCTNLLHAGIAPTNIVQLSGHKNVASLNNYATASRNQQQLMCNILMNPTPITSDTVPVNYTSRSPLKPLNKSPLIKQPCTANSHTLSAHSSVYSAVEHTTMNTATDPPTLFAGAVFHGGVFNITVHDGLQTSQNINKHKRRRIIYSDSDSSQ